MQNEIHYQQLVVILKIGDRVEVLDESISGVISLLEHGNVTIVTSDGFEMKYTEKELILANSSLSNFDLIPNDISTIISEKTPKKNRNSKRIKPKDRKLPPMEVDLHIHKLIPKTKGLDNYEMLNIQLDTVKRQLEFAFSKKIQRIVFIHGVGEGVLRTELEYLLKRYDNIKFYDADFQKYGIGATEVYVFQSKTP